MFYFFCFSGVFFFFFFSSRRRHTRWPRDWSSDVCSSDLYIAALMALLFFLLFIRQEHTEDTPHKLSNFYIFILVVYSIFVLVTEPVVFTNTFAFLQLLIISIISTIFTITIIGVFRNCEVAILNVIAILVLTVAVLNDLLHYSNLIHTNELISVGLLFYLFIQSVHLARKFYIGRAHV